MGAGAPSTDNIDARALDAFVARWRANEGGAERANYVLFLTELCDLLGLPRPDPADATHYRNDYVFERVVDATDTDGRISHRRIDLYRRGCFVLEAKQSREPGRPKEVHPAPEQPALPGLPPPERGRRSAARGWDLLMRNARVQAEDYARALPASHGWPPFILVCDVGHVIELFADFSGQGKAYRQFPDRATYRVYLDDLYDAQVRDRLRAVWLDPLSLDPARESAKVTRDIAGRLAQVSRLLETRGQDPGKVADFLMRCLFTIFAQSPDVRLLDPGDFTELLDDARANPDSFPKLLEDLWSGMDKGEVSAALRKRVRRFNGGLFKHARAIPLEREEIGELYEASRYDWTQVEPAIFGTFVEQALDPAERRRLGAHYTPRAYVERLVDATVIEPLQREWAHVLGTVERERAGDREAAIRAVHDFHVKLARTRVLDPACGTGNFLYIALELMKRLEGEVLEVLVDLGGQEALALETETVHPKNFFGIELNHRAAAVTELVLWLGYIQWQLRNRQAITDPVLEELSTIRRGDAVLAHGGERFGPDGASLGYADPRRPDWPEADYIVGNPPFIGGKDLRGRLGDEYVTALWKAHPKMGRSADFVMYWWDRAAERLTEKGGRLKRFGLVTTNSITQEFSRRVIARRMDGRSPIGVVLAIPDHPWTKATRDAAAVRIAMTVVEAGAPEGGLLAVVEERGLDTDAPVIEFVARRGVIGPDLTLSAGATSLPGLRANADLSMRGVEFHGEGYVLTARELTLLATPGDLRPYVRPFIASGDVKSGMFRDRYVLDLHDLGQEEVRQRFPAIYQHLLTTARPSRAKNRVKRRREEWWKLALPHEDLRSGIAGLDRYIATVVTAKHRNFIWVPGDHLPDQGLMVIASNDPFVLGVLSSRMHLVWTLRLGGTLEDRPRYNNTLVFDTYPFPVANPSQRAHIGRLAEELDANRKEVLAAYPDLTLTNLYNLRDKVAAGKPLDLVEQDQRARGRIDLLIDLHRLIDAAVADAYGWPADLQEEEVVARLVALNAERRADEKRGHVEWLRPDYQLGRTNAARLPTGGPEQMEALLPDTRARKPTFPRDLVGQTAAVFDALSSGGALTASDIAARFAQGRRAEPRIAATLAALARLGHAASEADRFRLRRAA
ncbi:class I SAM-dependent DNA methyltransferase [Sphingomonas lenta]|uniref:site-specific DNA-methyltransferase (adenine-specific) n=1 Tax=Sphingomonas lenta TaxID=1141887 RepID=A0A2A2SF11_9SPHN|nr:DNA methyltransferase [Sphingomonas lenta]PAX07829.1 restriction endonuclease subunit M [Sphingomonas lenta]